MSRVSLAPDVRDLKGLVCAGKLTLNKARAEIAGNWVAYWKAWKGY